MPAVSAKPKFFKTPAAFRAWLEKNHAKIPELWIGYYKKGSGRGGMVYKEALDQALCFGWIDGVVRSVDGESYMQRFTPRTKTSHWSLVNVRRFGELDALGLVEPPGRAAFDRKTPERTGRASYESAPVEFTAEQWRAFQANAKAAGFFERQPPGYKRLVKHWVTTAKREETRQRRLAFLIECSAKGERIPQLVSSVSVAAKKTTKRR